MGLDSVELVMEIEDRFEITIPNEDAANLETTRDVIDYVHGRIGDVAWTPCPTQLVFHRFRRALNCNALRVRPTTPLEHLLPHDSRRSTWLALPNATGMIDWPVLVRPSLITRAAWALTLLPAIAIGVATGSALLGLLSIATLGVATHVITRPLATEFPEKLVSAGDLARWVAKRNLPPASGGWTRDAVRLAVRAIVKEQLGLDDTYSDDASFVHDLGID